MLRRAVEGSDDALLIGNQQAFSHTAENKRQALTFEFSRAPQSHLPFAQTHIFQRDCRVISDHRG